MTTPADELRAAAARLRALTAEAHPGPWEHKTLPPDERHKHHAYWVTTNRPDEYATIADCPWRAADAAYIATMHPGVGTALADWLDSAAYDAETIGPDPQALAVARLINQEPPQ